MRKTCLGILVGAILVTAVGILHNALFAQSPTVRTPHISPTGEMIALSQDLGEGRQQVTVIDPKARVMAVYRIETASGEISLMSVRNIHWDLQMEEFNGKNPSPRDIRSLLEQR